MSWVSCNEFEAVCPITAHLAKFDMLRQKYFQIKCCLHKQQQ